MSVNKWSATEQTLTTLAGIDREAISQLEEEITDYKGILEENLIKYETVSEYQTQTLTNVVAGWFDTSTQTYEMGAAYQSVIIDVEEGEQYKFSGQQGSSSKKPFLLRYDDSTSKYVAVNTYEGANKQYVDYEYTVPADVDKLMIQGLYKTTDVVVKKLVAYTVKHIFYEKNPLTGKKIGLVGDSICYGNGYVGGYGKLVADRNQMTLQNLGIGSTQIMGETCGSSVITLVNGKSTLFKTVDGSGNFDASLIDFTKTDDLGTIQYCTRAWNSSTTCYDCTPITQAEWDGSSEIWIMRHSIPDRVDFLDSDCDYVIAEGGINDIKATPLGTITTGYTSAIDKNTICGGMELLCRNMITKFEGKKLGFIFVHKALNYPYTVVENGKGTMTEYFDKMKEVLKKYSIPYLDLYNDSALNTGISAYLKYTNANDGVHPNESGYMNFYVPKIEAWLKTL